MSLRIEELSDDDLDDFITIVANAYPDIRIESLEDRKRHKERIILSLKSNARLVGAYLEGKLVGGARYHDFKMNFYGKIVDACGLGLVAVDLLHKKEKICKELVLHFIEYTRNRAFIGMLYPFRPDFYYKMGFGFGTKMEQYRIKANSIPMKSKENIRFLTKEDLSYLLSCYNKFAQSRHGMLIRTSASFGHIFEDTQNRIVGCFNDDKLDAYCVFSFKPTMQDTMFQNDIFIKELVYNNSDSLNRILTFLSTQSDQVNNIIINTQEDDFYHLFPDPRDGSNRIIPSVYHESNTAGVGIMYRVVDIPGLVNTLFSKVDYDGKLKLKLTLSDSFYPKNSGSYYIYFSDNEGSISDDKDVDVELVTDISPFSSLVMGSVALGSLLRLGLANLSDDKYYPILARIFSKGEKPICMTPF